MHSIKHLTDKKIKKDLLDNFLNFINGELGIDTPYSVYFIDDKLNASDALGKTAMYNPSTKSVYVYVTNRHPKDIMRSIAHELVHHKQHCNGDLENMSLEKAEVQANAGGYYLRMFEDQLEENKLNVLKEEAPGSMGAGDYEKCLSGQEKRNGLCYPRNFKGDFNKPVSDLTLKDCYQIYLDIKRTKRKQRDSVFYQNPKLVKYGLIYPKIRKTIANVKNAPKVPADYSNQLVKYYELLKKEQESRLQRGNDQEPQNEQAKKIDPKLKKLILYPQSVIDDARRIYKMTEKGSGGQGDPFGFYYYGPDNDPFDKSIKIPPTLQKDIINRLGGQKRTDEIIEVYSQHFSSSSAINKADQDFAETVHLTLDVVGMSPDPLGFGLMADLLNGILYLSRGEYLDATFSFAGLTVFGDALKIERGPLRVFFRSLRNLRKGVIYILDAKIARTLIRWLGAVQRFVFPRLKKLVSRFKSVGITTLPGGVSTEALEKGIKEGEQVVIGTKNYLIQMEKLRSELSDKISWMYTGRLNTAMLRKLIVENLDVAKTILRNILANNPSVKKLLLEGDLLEKIINKYPAKFKAIGVDITGKTKSEIVDIIQNKLQPILNKTIDILVDEATKNKAALETFLEDIFEQIDIIELDKKVVEILKTRFEEAFKAIFGLNDTMSIGAAIKVVADKLADPNTLRQVQKEAEEVLKEVLQQTLSTNPAVVNAAESFFKRTYRRALATVAPGIFRSLASFFSSVGNFASATVGKMIAKNVLGLDGLLGEMYKAAARRMKQLWDLDALKIVARPGNVSKLGRLGFRLGKLILLWITSLPFFVLGKLNIFGIYYTRYYRHYCGGFEQFKKEIGEKALTELFDTWLAVGKYAVEVPLTITAALLEATTGGAIGEGSIKKIQKAIDQGIEYINKILNSKSSQSWYEELSDYIVGVSTAPFKCKKRDTIISSAPGFMRGLVTKEITELEKGLSTETLGLIRAQARGYNTKYQKMLKSVNDDNVSLPEFARMSQEQIGAMTPMSNIPTGQTVASPRDTAIKVADKVIKSKKTTPAQKAAAKKYKDQLGQDPNVYEESKSLSDYREKVLNERLEKLTIGFTK